MADDDIPPLDDMTEILGKMLQIKEVKSVSEKFSPNKTAINGQQKRMKSSLKSNDEMESNKKENNVNTAPNKSESFGGMRKGFLFSSPKDDLINEAPKQTKEIPFISKQNINEKNTLRFDEVQSAMKINEAIQPHQDKLLKMIESNEKMCSKILDPSFMKAIKEFQTNPHEAMEKYKDNKEIQSFFKDFCSIVGDHLMSVGSEDESNCNPAAANRTIITEMSEDEADDMKESKSLTKEDEKVHEILNDHEMKKILLDPKIRRLIEALKNDSNEADRLLRSSDRELHLKIQKLVENGLLQIKQ